MYNEQDAIEMAELAIEAAKRGEKAIAYAAGRAFLDCVKHQPDAKQLAKVFRARVKQG